MYRVGPRRFSILQLWLGLALRVYGSSTKLVATLRCGTGIRPGSPTSDYLDFVLTRLTAIGATYLAAVCILPEILISKYSIPFYLGGTSLLIVVTVSMDTVAAAQSHLIAHRYSGLIKKTKLRGGRR